MAKKNKPAYPQCKEIEVEQMEAWLALGEIETTDIGNENVYFQDKNGNEFYCKCYPA